MRMVTRYLITSDFRVTRYDGASTSVPKIRRKASNDGSLINIEIY